VKDVVCLLQIITPDEYDCMFTCRIRSQSFYCPDSPSKCYAGLRVLSKAWEPSKLLFRSTDGDFLCPKAFKADFRQHVENALQSARLTDTNIGKSHGVGPSERNPVRTKAVFELMVHRFSFWRDSVLMGFRSIGTAF